MEHLGVSLHQNAVTEFLEGIQKSNNLIKRASAMIKDVRPPAFALTEHVLALNAANILQVGAPSANLSRTLLEESGVQFAPAFKSAKLPKVLRRPLRLAVVPSDPLAAYTAKGYSDTYLTSYYNPNGFFDEVFLLSPYEKERKVQGGMVILPLCSSFDQRGSPKCSAHELVSNMKDLLYDLQVHLVRAYGGYWPCRLAANARSGNIPVVVSVHDTNPALLYKEIGDADYVLPVSVPVQRLVIKKGVAPNNVLLFTNRVDLELFRLERSKEEEASIASLKKKYPGRYRVLFVGRFYRGGNSTVAQKNWDTLLRAIPHLGPDYTFVMIGKGSEYAAQALADDLNAKYFARPSFAEFSKQFPNGYTPDFDFNKPPPNFNNKAPPEGFGDWFSDYMKDHKDEFKKKYGNGRQEGMPEPPRPKVKPKRNLYQILDLTPRATQENIKKSFRKLAREFHPDKHKGSKKKEMEEKFVELANAYEILSDVKKRRRYDMGGPNAMGDMGPDDINGEEWDDFGGFSSFEEAWGAHGGGKVFGSQPIMSDTLSNWVLVFVMGSFLVIPVAISYGRSKNKAKKAKKACVCLQNIAKLCKRQGETSLHGWKRFINTLLRPYDEDIWAVAARIEAKSKLKKKIKGKKPKNAEKKLQNRTKTRNY
eukprot:g7595.t1